jgi:4-hydroxybenzoyl-CoA reductase beta subunit
MSFAFSSPSQEGVMRLSKFQLLQPQSAEQAAQFLDKYKGSVGIMAGGTDILPRMKYGLKPLEFIISLRHLPIAEPKDADGDIVLDALMTLSDTVRNEKIRQNAFVLAEAAHAVASYQIRNMGTLGGNLCQESRCLYYNQIHQYQFVSPCFKRNGDRCHFIPKGHKCFAVFMSDTAPALYSLDASVEVLSNGHLKRIPIDELYTGNSLTPIALSEQDLLVAIRIPKVTGLRGSAFAKFTIRGGLEFAGVNAAVVLEVKDDGVTCSNVRITVGAIAPAPVRLRGTEAMLIGQKLSDDLLDSAARAASEESKPIAHHGFSSKYLKTCLISIAREALFSAYSRIAR